MKAVAQRDVEQGGAGDRIAELGGKVDRLDGRVDELSGRVDELGRRVDNGFNRVDAKFEWIDDKLDKQAESMVAEFKRVDARLTDELTAVRKEISEGFLRMQRLMIQGGGGVVVALLVASRLLG